MILAYVALLTVVGGFIYSLHPVTLNNNNNNNNNNNKTMPEWTKEGVLLISMVKNEAGAIQEMIESSKTVAGYWFFCDTGSKDNTTDIIQTALKGHGSRAEIVVQSPFVNFSHNRNACLKAAREAFSEQQSQIKWILLMDADHRVVVNWDKAHIKPLNDMNYISIQNKDDAYGITNTLLYLVKFSVLQHCKYRLYSHELLQCTPPKGKTFSVGHFQGFYYKHEYWKGGSKLNKFSRDVRLLKQWILDTANNPSEQDLFPRALFYLARSYQGLGKYSLAIKTYEQHREVEIYTNYWFYSRYARAQCIYGLCGQNFTTCGYSFKEVEQAYLDAHNEMDGYFRQEPLYYLGRMHASNGNYSRCVLYASAGENTPPIDYQRMPLFLESVIYNGAMKDLKQYCTNLIKKE